MGLIQAVTGAVQKMVTSSPPVLSTQEQTRHTALDSTNKGAMHDQRVSARQSSISILVLGRSGAGKTYFIDHTCSSEWNDDHPAYEKTMDVKSDRAIWSGVKFKLIDTPGFDSLSLSDVEVFTKITEYLLRPPASDQGIHGIIYLHQAGDTLQSRSLLRNVTLLSNLFIGDEGYSRLTIFVSRSSARRMEPKIVEDELGRPGSVFSAACAGGAKIVIPSSNRSGFMKVVMSYASMDPILLPVQQHALRNGPSETLARLEDNMWYWETESAHRRLKDLEHRQESELRELHLKLSDKDLRLKQYHAACDEAEKLRVSQQEVEVALHQQLRQVQQEYASLRSQLQLQDNSEQSEIVQELKDLNRDIDDIGRLISAHLTDSFVRDIFKKDPADITALDAHDLPRLKASLDHTDGKPSLIASSQGVGMDVESFFDFTIRAFLCTFLSTKIFEPFHPAIDSAQNSTLLGAYEDIQKREPQSAAGKWRSSTFKSIYKPETSNSTLDLVGEFAHEFVRDYLGPFIAIFLGRNHATLEIQHFNRLRQLITRAWDWNAKLRGDVIILGDFVQILYPAGSDFDTRLMDEFESDPSKPQAKVILGTIAFGLISQRALGGGQPPEESVVLKPLVITDNLYA